nr:glycosyltransferase [Actinotalea subterranea]
MPAGSAAPEGPTEPGPPAGPAAPARTAVVVVSYGSADLLERHLARTSSGTGATVVVVDNFSTHAERAAVTRVCERHGWHLVAREANDGFGAGVNAGAERARALGCDVLVLLNPDLAAAGAVVDALADAVREDPRALVAPAIDREDGTPWSRGGLLDVATGRTRTRGVAPERAEWLSGACLAVHLSLWDDVGGFDEDYFLYWEDVDLSWRVRGAGGHLVVRTDLTATHSVGGTQRTADPRRKSGTYYAENCRGRLLFAAKHLDPAGVRRWRVTAPGYARDVVLRGGRRQLLRSPAPLAAVLRGTLAGLSATRRAQRAGRPASGGAGRSATRHLLVAHPSPDVYGSDRQLLETVEAAVAAGWSVEVALPGPGPLVPLLRERGARVRRVRMPVLRKALLHPRRLPGFAVDSVTATLRLTRLLRRERPDVLYVNTITIPTWLVAARLAGVPRLCHVHEAEEHHRLVTAGLLAPLALADLVVANSAAARDVVASALPRVGGAVRVVHNGVPGPATEPAPAQHDRAEPWRLVVVGRLSPRKGIDVALDAVDALVLAGYDVTLDVCGTVFPGYEWYERELRDAATGRPRLIGRVQLLGYVHPTWPHLAAADVVLVPSRSEPFGNTAVEGMLARRPVVASRAQGLAEVVHDGRTGLLVAPGDATALAGAVRRLLDDAGLRQGLADAARTEALARFSTGRYAADVVRALEEVRAGMARG